jgi:hypothetical protein
MSRLAKPGTPPSTGAAKQPCSAPWQRDKQAAEGAVKVGSGVGAEAAGDGVAAGAGADAAGAGTEAVGAPRGAGVVVVATGALFSGDSSELARFFGAAGASMRGAALVATAGGSGVGRGRSCSLPLQPTASANSAAAGTNHARRPLSILKQSPSF